MCEPFMTKFILSALFNGQLVILIQYSDLSTTKKWQEALIESLATFL